MSLNFRMNGRPLLSDSSLTEILFPQALRVVSEWCWAARLFHTATFHGIRAAAGGGGVHLPSTWKFVLLTVSLDNAETRESSKHCFMRRQRLAGGWQELMIQTPLLDKLWTRCPVSSRTDAESLLTDFNIFSIEMNALRIPEASAPKQSKIRQLLWMRHQSAKQPKRWALFLKKNSQRGILFWKRKRKRKKHEVFLQHCSWGQKLEVKTFVKHFCMWIQSIVSEAFTVSASLKGQFAEQEEWSHQQTALQ